MNTITLIDQPKFKTNFNQGYQNEKSSIYKRFDRDRR